MLSGREVESTAGVIDGQLVETTKSRGPCGDDAGKKKRIASGMS